MISVGRLAPKICCKRPARYAAHQFGLGNAARVRAMLPLDVTADADPRPGPLDYPVTHHSD